MSDRMLRLTASKSWVIFYPSTDHYSYMLLVLGCFGENSFLIVGPFSIQILRPVKFLFCIACCGKHPGFDITEYTKYFSIILNIYSLLRYPIKHIKFSLQIRFFPFTWNFNMQYCCNINNTPSNHIISRRWHISIEKLSFKRITKTGYNAQRFHLWSSPDKVLLLTENEKEKLLFKTEADFQNMILLWMQAFIINSTMHLYHSNMQEWDHFVWSKRWIRKINLILKFDAPELKFLIEGTAYFLQYSITKHDTTMARKSDVSSSEVLDIIHQKSSVKKARIQILGIVLIINPIEIGK